MRRYELSDEQYELVADLLPRGFQRVGGRWKDHRQVLNGIFWILHTGAQWREVPERYGKWQTIFHRFNRWRKDGTIDKMLERLHMQLGEDGRIDVDTWLIDATLIRASRSAAGGPRGEKGGRRARRSRAGAIKRRLRYQAAPGN